MSFVLCWCGLGSLNSFLTVLRDLFCSRRPYNFIPQKFDSMRHIPLYDDFIKERFERCLDLYLCPRTRRKKVWHCCLFILASHVELTRSVLCS